MGGSSEPYFSEGKQTGNNGYLFNESPPPPGESRKWESWEAPWCGGFGHRGRNACALNCMPAAV